MEVLTHQEDGSSESLRSGFLYEIQAILESDIVLKSDLRAWTTNRSVRNVLGDGKQKDECTDGIGLLNGRTIRDGVREGDPEFDDVCTSLFHGEHGRDGGFCGGVSCS
jgi:hypothetical protein